MAAALPFSARQQFLQKGYAILPNALPLATVQRIRAGALQSTTARSRFFYNLPNMEELLKSNQSKMSDPFLDPLLTQIDKRRFLLRYYKQLKRQRRQLTRTVRKFLNGRTREDLSPEELWRLSELVVLEAHKASGRGCTSTVHNDAQLLASIDNYRANAWMTSADLTEVLTSDQDLKSALATVAEIVGGVEKPVVFGDSPLLRPVFGNPVGYHCTAPVIGTRTNAPQRGGGVPAVTLLIFTYVPTRQRLEPHVLENSHKFVRDQYIHQVHPRRLFSTFLPLEAHIPQTLQQFHFDSSVVGRSLLDCEGSSNSSSGGADGSGPIGAGTVVAVDPHLMMAFGPNATWDDEVVYRLNVVNEEARPFLSAPSWVRGWRSLPREVHFASPVMFPPLYA